MTTRYSNCPQLFARIVTAVCLTAVFSPVCFARLGETEAQLRARYGEGKNVDIPDNAWDDQTLEFTMPGPDGGEIIVVANLVDDVSIAENYLFYAEDGSRASVAGEVLDAAKTIVNANSQGRVWREVPPGLTPAGMEVAWVRSDNQANTAVVWKNQPYILEIGTAESNKRIAKHKSGVSGF
jgi:hypothetical protein